MIADMEKLLTAEEIAELLQVSKKTISRMLLTGEIPSVRITGRPCRGIRRVLRKDYEAFVRAHRGE